MAQLHANLPYQKHCFGPYATLCLLDVEVFGQNNFMEVFCCKVWSKLYKLYMYSIIYFTPLVRQMRGIATTCLAQFLNLLCITCYVYVCIPIYLAMYIILKYT